MTDSQSHVKIQALEWVMDANSISLEVLQSHLKARNTISRLFLKQTKTPEKDAQSEVADKYLFHEIENNL